MKTQKKYIIYIIFTLFSSHLHSQFEGSNFSGQASSFFSYSILCGSYKGGFNSGQNSTFFTYSILCGSFKGGLNGGYTLGQFINPYACAQFTSSTSNGSGSSSRSLSEDLGSCYTMFLPIESSPLFGIVAGRNGELTWETYSEINNQGFEIQRTSDGINWLSIGWIDGAGNSTETLKYSFTDYNLKPGDFYYRFKQLDYDGKTSYSNIVLLNLNKLSNDQNLFLLYPNPSSNGQNLQIRSWLDKEMETTIQIRDMIGRELAIWKHTFEKNASIYTLPSNYSPGTYYITIISMRDGETFKVPFTIN